jgi:hypothetical protein
MRKSELDAVDGAIAFPPAIPVICDACRASGTAGEDPFTHLADLLSFTPVNRRARADGWDAERQRAFIAALAVTGSPRQAARAIGKHAFGAEQLRKARGGSSFATAWDAALDIARECELAGLRDGLTELAAEHQEERQHRRSAILPAGQRAAQESPPVGGPGVGEGLSSRPSRRLTKREEEDAEFGEQHRDYLEARDRIRSRLTRARRLYLAMISDDPARRAAWELLVGPVDWTIAAALGAQEDEPFADPEHPGCDIQPHNFAQPGMLLTAEAGLLPDIAGGHDAMAGIREALDNIRADEAALPPEEGASQSCWGQDEKHTAAIAAHRDSLKAEGEADF